MSSGENDLRAATRLSWKSLPARVSVTLCHHKRRERTEGVLESLRGAAANPGRSVTLKLEGRCEEETHTQLRGGQEENHNDP